MYVYIYIYLYIYIYIHMYTCIYILVNPDVLNALSQHRSAYSSCA